MNIWVPPCRKRNLRPNRSTTTVDTKIEPRFTNPSRPARARCRRLPWTLAKAFRGLIELVALYKAAWSVGDEEGADCHDGGSPSKAEGQAPAPAEAGRAVVEAVGGDHADADEELEAGVERAAPLGWGHLREVQPPSTMMFRRPKASVRQLATRDEANPAIYSEDVNAVKAWLS
ncbi:hypothetical protein Acr_04g0005660 [Actinidia rufa]|uniref:Uncharacterized protein n=1 Tax=Actinidia rufa TaxID=165716 RepID=A0A7J0EH80_9ERIC|nr:hypothetical protein Acr_04g0005660 [Actinidia rufa]